ncbi:MAG: zinc-dependent alcohol dehydrogenase family protein [Acidobacteriota bacterium]|nr:zinc-dependent alcohol dehydrogenase family protein [Acidobacteriota bacterium]
MRAMAAAAFGAVENNPLSMADLPVPPAGPGKILVRVRRCGVCHTDLHVVEGELPAVKLPIIPGHEVVGTVEKRGEGAEKFREGDRVGVAWLHSACGECRFCREGRENLCDKARFTGCQVDGGYAEFLAVPEAFAYRLPEVFTDEEAAPLLCAGIIGYRALRLSSVRPGERLGLYGFGASAHVAIQIARHWGCEVYVFTRSEEHRELARSLGAAWTGNSKDIPPERMAGSIIFAPAGEIVSDALEGVERGGTVVTAGIYMTAVGRLDYARHLYQEKILRSVANATRRDGEGLLELASRIPVRTACRVFPLEEANAALQLLKAGRINGAAVLKIAD